MSLKHPGGQARFSTWLTPEPSHIPCLAALLEWIPTNPAGDLSLETFADRACISPRTLLRVFLQELGVTPGCCIERARLEATYALLQDTQTSVATVPRLCGFDHPENPRRTFYKHLSVSPREYVGYFGMLVWRSYRGPPHAGTAPQLQVLQL